jgi:hypothetical protein
MDAEATIETPRNTIHPAREARLSATPKVNRDGCRSKKVPLRPPWYCFGIHVQIRPSWLATQANARFLRNMRGG